MNILYRNINFKKVSDGIIYSIAISIGFAFFENIIYLTGTGDPISLIVSRSLTTVPLHTLTGAYMGFFGGMSKEKENNMIRVALLSSVMIHGIYNVIISLPSPYNNLGSLLIFTSAIVLRVLFVKKTR